VIYEIYYKEQPLLNRLTSFYLRTTFTMSYKFNYSWSNITSIQVNAYDSDSGWPARTLIRTAAYDSGLK
jgi:hypothetical protein